MTTKTLCIIIPVFNEAEGLPSLLDRLDSIATDISTEFALAIHYIFVDDGSSDDSFALLKAYDFGARPVRLLQFSRNFGKEAALSAGIDAADYADAAVLMDADLQHPPEMIAAFVRIWLTDEADSVYAYKINRRFMKALHSLPESDRFMKGLYGWVGFRQTGIPLEPPPRIQGKSSYHPLRLMLMTLDAITSFTTAPLRLMAMAGFVIATVSAVYGIYVVVQHFLFPAVPTGIVSVLALTAFFGGVQMIFLGILGEYVGKSVLEAKKRPPYIVAEDISRKGNALADRR